jgi:molybdopterin synthase sulfur carrier subunit
MPNVHIPAAMRALTGGETKVAVSGATLGEVIDRLEERYPGLKSRMVDDGKLRRGLAAFVNDQSLNAGLQTKVGPDDEVYFAPAIAGGTGPCATSSADERSPERVPRTGLVYFGAAGESTSSYYWRRPGDAETSEGGPVAAYCKRDVLLLGGL